MPDKTLCMVKTELLKRLADYEQKNPAMELDESYCSFTAGLRHGHIDGLRQAIGVVLDLIDESLKSGNEKKETA